MMQPGDYQDRNNLFKQELIAKKRTGTSNTDQLSCDRLVGIDRVKITLKIRCLLTKTTKTSSFILLLLTILKLQQKVAYRCVYLSHPTSSNLIFPIRIIMIQSPTKMQIFTNSKQSRQKVVISIPFQVADDWGLTFRENRRNFKSYSSLAHQCRTLHLRPMSRNRCSCWVVLFLRRGKHRRSGNRLLPIKLNYRRKRDECGASHLGWILTSGRCNESGGARLLDLSIYDGRTEFYACLVQLIFIINFGKTSSKKRTHDGNLCRREAWKD